MTETIRPTPPPAAGTPTLTAERLLTQDDLAVRWGCSPKTIERWRVQGSGPVYVRLAGLVRYRVQDVLNFENKALRRSTAEPATPEKAR